MRLKVADKTKVRALCDCVKKHSKLVVFYAAAAAVARSIEWQSNSIVK